MITKSSSQLFSFQHDFIIALLSNSQRKDKRLAWDLPDQKHGQIPYEMYTEIKMGIIYDGRSKKQAGSKTKLL